MSLFSRLVAVLALQKVLEQVAQELQSNILESKRRAMKEFQDLLPFSQWMQGHDVLMSKGRIAPVDQSF
jgi:hypothetical protein